MSKKPKVKHAKRTVRRRERAGPPPTAGPAAISDPPSRMLVGLTALAAVAAYSFGMWMVVDSPTADEVTHYPQIKEFAEGRFEIHRRLTVLPGYHAIIAALAWAGGDPLLPAARAVSWGLCALAPVLFFLCARALGKDNRFSLSLAFLLSPLTFPHFFYLYTDIPSLLFLLGVLLLTLRRRYRLAGLMAILSLLLRQSNVVWVFFFALVALGQEGVWARLARRDFRPVLHVLARLWLFVFAGLAFLAFVYWNGGIALGDADMHRADRLYPTQVYLLLFTVFLLFVPLHIRNLPRIARMLRRRPILCLFIGVMLLAFYLQTFWVNHPYNYSPYESLQFRYGYLRNEILRLLKETLWLRVAVFIPMAWALCSLCVTPLQRRSFYWLYPLAAAALLPAGLIDQRYFIVPVVLFMLTKKHESAALDLWTIAVYVPATGLLYHHISQGGVFL